MTTGEKYSISNAESTAATKIEPLKEELPKIEEEAGNENGVEMNEERVSSNSKGTESTCK